MPLNLRITSASLPTSLECLISDDKWQDLVALLSGVVDAEISIFNTGNTEPSPANRVWPWLRTNADGSPDATYNYWSGSWVSRHPLPPGSVMMYRGTEASIATFDGGVAGTVTPISGPFWEPVTAMAARFPVHPGTFAGGTSVAVAETGGEDYVALALADMPAHRHNVPSNGAVFVDVSTGGNYLVTAPTGTEHRIVPFETEGGGPDNAGDGHPHQNLPPFFGIYFIERSLRLFRTI